MYLLVAIKAIDSEIVIICDVIQVRVDGVTGAKVCLQKTLHMEAILAVLRLVLNGLVEGGEQSTDLLEDGCPVSVELPN